MYFTTFLFIHPMTDTYPYPGYCEQWYIENGGAYISSISYFSFPLNTYAEVELLEQSSFLKNLYVVFYSSCHQLTFPPVVHRGSLFTSLPILISSLFVCFSDDSHSNRYGLVDLNGVMLSEINQAEKDKSCGLSLICEI